MPTRRRKIKISNDDSPVLTILPYKTEIAEKPSKMGHFSGYSENIKFLHDSGNCKKKLQKKRKRKAKQERGWRRVHMTAGKDFFTRKIPTVSFIRRKTIRFPTTTSWKTSYFYRVFTCTSIQIRHKLQ